jgi:hypothetical protein
MYVHTMFLTNFRLLVNGTKIRQSLGSVNGIGYIQQET